MFEHVDIRRRLVRAATALFSAVAASAGFSGPSRAQPAIVLEPGAYLVESAAASDGAIWLQTETRVDTLDRRYGLIRVAPDLGSHSKRELPESFQSGLVAFRDGVLTMRYERVSEYERRYHLYWIGPEPDAAVERWYTWSDTDVDPLVDFVAPASDGSAVYVISRRVGARLSKIGADGEEQWRRFIGERSTRAIVATADGVVALSIPNTVYQPRGTMLTAFSPSGEEAWRMEAAVGGEPVSGDIWFLPPSTLALRQPPGRSASGMAEPWRLVLFDTVDRSVRTLPIPVVASWVRPVPNGLLYAGSAMQLPFLALIGDDAEIRWTERVNFDDGTPSGSSRYLADARTSGPDEMVIVTGRRGDDERTVVEFIRTSLEMPELTTRYGRCVETNVLQLLEREQMISRTFRVGVRLQRTFRLSTERRPQPSLPADSDGCALPSESHYFGFLSELADELARRDFEPLEQVVVRFDVDALEPPYLLNAYHVNWQVRDAPATNVQYLADASAARALAEHLTETVLPHFERMLGAVDAFRDLTGCRLTVEKPPGERNPPDADRFYAATEQAVDHVLEEARRVAPELNAAENASRYCALRVNELGFGGYDELRPLSRAAETLRELSAGRSFPLAAP